MNTSRFARLQATREVRISHPRKSVDMTAGLAMVVFCLALGFQQVAIKSVIGDISSLAQIALRSALAFVLVAVLVRWRGISLHDLRARLGAGVGVGLGPHTCPYFSTRRRCLQRWVCIFWSPGSN